MFTERYNEVLKVMRFLTLDEQQKLLEDLLRIIHTSSETRPPRSVLELEGLGAEIWEGVDVEGYINRERDSWEPFFQALFRGDFTIVTSIVTLLEVMVHPIQKGDVISAKKYRDILFDTQGISTITLTQSISEEAARLHASYKITTPDAIQVATAIQGNASIFFTNDIHLLSVSGLEIVTLDEIKTRPENLNNS